MALSRTRKQAIASQVIRRLKDTDDFMAIYTFIAENDVADADDAEEIFELVRSSNVLASWNEEL